MLNFKSTPLPIRSLVLTGLIIFLSFNPTFGQAPKQFPEMAHFDKVATYLTQGSGQWKAPNPRYNPDNPNSAEAFGLWFEKSMRNFLNLKIVSYQKDKVLTSSEGFFAWHPGKKQYVHVNGNRGNGYSEGITSFPNDSTFISTMTIFTRRGSFYEHKDENFIVDENVHRNVSYRKDEEGNWIEENEWTWTRVPED